MDKSKIKKYILSSPLFKYFLEDFLPFGSRIKELFSEPEAIEHFSDGKGANEKEVWQFVSSKTVTYPISAIAFYYAAGMVFFTEISDESFLTSGLSFLNFSMVIGGLICIIILLLFFVLKYIKKRSLRSLEMKNQLHVIAHAIRDVQIDVAKKAKINDNCPDIKAISDDLCLQIQKYFKILIPNKDIGVAIRIADKSGVEATSSYKTYGRAGLNQHRHESSEPLRRDAGVARRLITKKFCKGVSIYNDLNAAIEHGSYHETSNDIKYPNDVKKMMVAPINGWDSEKKAMLGILFITSNSPEKTFAHKHVDSMAFVTDILATMYSDLILYNIIKK